nr:GntR family transcriptional regulator [Halalkalibacter oceani]
MYEIVYESLKTAIINGEYAPGEKLIEARIAERYNASRTPIREAIRKLEREGLVEFTSGQGCVVTELTKEEIISIYECRSVLEGLAARKAAKMITTEQLELLEENLILCQQFLEQNKPAKVISKNTEFHDTIIVASHNEPLISMMDQLRSQILRYRIFHSNVGFRPNFLDEHTAIFEAVKSRNEDLAEAVTREHYMNDAEYFIKWARD